MKNNKTLILISFFILFCIVIALLMKYSFDKNPITNNETNIVNSFEECVEAGGDLAESYPRQCFLGQQAFHEKNNDEIITFRGEIIDIEDGIDGSTVTLQNNEEKLIKTTISIPNLGPNSDFDFSDIKKGNSLFVSGKSFEMENITYITAQHAGTIFSQSKKAECEANGNEYKKMGKSQFYQCDEIAKDAGNTCNNSNDCEGLCLSNDTTGVCSEKLHNFGCNDIWEDGKIQTLCID